MLLPTPARNMWHRYDSLRRARTLIVGEVTLTLLVSASARADELANAPVTREARVEHPRARLEYRADDAACPDESHVRTMVRTRLGYDPFSRQGSTERFVDLRIERRDGALRGRVVVRSRSTSLGARELTSGDCDELVSSLSVTIAVGIDPLSFTGSPPRSTRDSADPPPPKDAPKEPSTNESTEDPWSASADRPHEPAAGSGSARVRVHVGPLVSIGAAPVTTPGMAIGAGVRWRTASLVGEGRVDLPVVTRTITGGAISAAVLLGNVVPCFHFGVARACALISAGVLRASSENVTAPRHTTNFFSALGARAGVEFPLREGIAFGAYVDLLATLTRITLRFDGHDVWTTPVASGAGGVHLTGAF